MCDNIDPTTHDFVSLTTTIDPIDAQVIIALKVVRASGPSVAEDGNRLHEVRKMGDGAQAEIKSLVQEALSRLIFNRDIRYLGTDFDYWEPGYQAGTATVKWVNLRARDKQTRTHSFRFPEE